MRRGREGGREPALVWGGSRRESVQLLSPVISFRVCAHDEERLPFPVASSEAAEEKLSCPWLCVSFTGVPDQVRV